MKNKLAIIGLSLFIFSCTSENELVDKTDSNSVEREETVPVNKEVTEKAVEKTELKKTPWSDIKGSAYEIVEKLVTQKVNVGSVREVDVWYTTEGLVIDFVDENGLFTGTKLLSTPMLNEFNLEMTAEIKNVVGAEDSANELVLKWESMDGRNGMEEGFEMELAGFFIIDLESVSLVQDLIYVDHQLSYDGNATEEDLKDEDYHAKKAESTDFEICSYSHKVKLELNKLIVTDYYKQQEGSTPCELKDYTGTYTFDVDKGIYSK